MKKTTEEKKALTQETVLKLLDSCYERALDGIPLVSESVEELAAEYLKKHKTPEKAARAMIKNQVAKCTTSGFLTGFGGFISMPVTIPANLSSVLYVQIRMIACVAHLAGMDLQADQTQTFVYACLAGVAFSGVLKKAGIQLGEKLVVKMITKIPGRVLKTINKKVGFRLLTKFGTKGLVNMGKMVPVVGAVIGGGMDLVETKVIGSRAIKWFFEGDFTGETDDDDDDDDDIIEEEEPSDTDNP